MTCPRCELGTITPVRFMESGVMAHVCSYCEALWLEHEAIQSDSMRTLSSYLGGGSREYIFEELNQEPVLTRFH